ncbi:hypothetical protein D7X55_38900 [Corallococcus sp. AB049A]|uniref:Uncharacterized protein n=1 Tax=Corallococcus interemptor TaxID=2316720 RepID=A0A3A8R1F5_9BACT|nr:MULTISPECIES: hypothetical protein [Corallococcus]RKH48003.1 hypothetical protein D7Y23_20940 [Corallococcus sp. AB050B]RKH73818.1 hypothetical protein D7X96_01440 [Corallococcus interemptor]RKI43061.1 hypothetical protein D7X55_38900 [Corallococcus sp. AB049A]
MPRSYSFDHFQVPKTLPVQKRSLRQRDKAQFAQSSRVSVDEHEGIHYGKSHAQTEEILNARKMELQLEELARPEADAKFSHGPVSKVSGAAKKQRKAAASPVIGTTAPIGALPPTQERPVEQGRLPDLIDEARRQLKAIQSGVGDVATAMQRLALLPLEAVRLAARRIIPA